MRTRPAAVMTRGFSIDLTTTDPAMSLNGVTDSTLGMYVYNRDSGFEPGIRVAPPGADAWLWDGVGESIPIAAGELRDRANADGLGPLAMVPAGLLMIGLGALRRRKARVGERRRKAPGVRKTPVYEARAPGQAKASERYVAV